MKRLLSIFVGSLIVSLSFCGVPFKYTKEWLEDIDGRQVKAAWSKNNALLTEILLKEYGDRGVCRLLYSLRERKNGLVPILIQLRCDSTYMFKEFKNFGDAVNGQEIYNCLKDENFPKTIRDALLRQNDTIFISFEPDMFVTDLSCVLRKGEGRSVWLGILLPENYRKEIQDSTAWEQEALRDIKEQLEIIKSLHVKLLEPPTDIPDSMKNVYKLYFDHSL